MRVFKFRAWLKDYEVMVNVKAIDFYDRYIVHRGTSFPTVSTDLKPANIDYLSDFKDCELM